MIDTVGYLISTHKDYTLPLSVLLDSMSYIPESQIYIVQGGYDETDSVGEEELADYHFYTVDHNSFDYAGIVAMVDGTIDVENMPDYIFMLHDTMEISEKTDALIRQADPDKLATAVWGGQCNLGLYQKEYILSRSDLIRGWRNCSKAAAIAYEGLLFRNLHPSLQGHYSGTFEEIGVGYPYGESPRLKEFYSAVEITKYKANHAHNTGRGEPFIVRP